MLDLNNLCYIYVRERSICKGVNDVERPIGIEPTIQIMESNQHGEVCFQYVS